MPATAGVICALKGFFSIVTMALASLPTMVCVGGVEACPPGLFNESSKLMGPFSAIPTRAHSEVTPGNTFSTTAPPSSNTIAGVVPCFSNHETMAGQLLPFTSSSPEKARYKSCFGLKPSDRSCSVASMMPHSVPLVSSVPRPHITLSAIRPSKAGFSQLSSIAGTTS